MSFDKRAYQKEFMRKRRGKRGESNLPVPVLAEPHPEKIEGSQDSYDRDGEARESTDTNLKRPVEEVASGTRGGQTFWDKEKYPNRKAWETAVVRAERAENYARMFPQFIKEEDLKYQTTEWQYQNEGIKAVKKPSTHFVPS